MALLTGLLLPFQVFNDVVLRYRTRHRHRRHRADGCRHPDPGVLSLRAEQRPALARRGGAFCHALDDRPAGADGLSARRLCRHRHVAADAAAAHRGRCCRSCFWSSQASFWPWRSRSAGPRSPASAAASPPPRFTCRHPCDFSSYLRVPRSWMMASLLVGVVLLFIVNMELILRSIVTLLGGSDRLKPLAPPEDEIMAE